MCNYVLNRSWIDLLPETDPLVVADDDRMELKSNYLSAVDSYAPHSQDVD